MSRRLALLMFVLLTAGNAQAQVVQLPSMHTFSIRTSVLVPDSGRAYLGGTNRSSHWMSSRGPGWGPLGRSAGRAGGVSATGGTITATIIDNSELDELVLEEARAIRAAKGIEAPVDTRVGIKPPRDAAPVSVAAIKRKLAAEDDALESEAEADFQKARDYERAGEGALARNYYRVAARKSTGVVKQKSLERLAALATKSTTKSR
jgi:hypothetical protein